ncbi:Phosphate-specific outer membrane porin OprP/OprO [Lysobacter dokdonensis DS-58]|uniref:Phosphate-specific outer membrane porin OprP/OprO n=1 Tax=Lysobacter dokdonensis DS-58 TaxID=1300345 RepID=A0A0A2WM50_9GAMM|nr:porin [Lysobacter dokdonensis]KGQ19802.1 Phosphate-specific outer membrane porin OprP/OprO [Lysobacter dokdonensis DS-58]
MNLTRSTLVLALLGAIGTLAAPAAHAQVAIDVIADSEVTFEGLVQADMYWYDADFALLNADGPDGRDGDYEMRRAELVLKGKGPGNIEWVMGYDAKADKWLDVNAKYKFGGNGNHFVQVGQYKQLMSLEELSSTKNNDFIAKASITNTFGLGRRLGGMYQYGDNNWAIAASMYTRELTEHPAPTPHGPGWGVRGYWAPINGNGNIFHVGASYNDYDTFGDAAQWRARPLADLSNRIVDTGTMRNTDRNKTFGLESFWAHGPFKVQGEYMKTETERYGLGPNSETFSADGAYISGLWNITGESFGYKNGVPTTPLPNNPAGGMWQVGLRYDTIDLNDGALFRATPTANPTVLGALGGEMDSWTVGVNWYWRSNFKFMLDYVMVDSSKYIGRTSATYAEDPINNNRTFNAVVDDNPNILEARLQFYW